MRFIEMYEQRRVVQVKLEQWVGGHNNSLVQGDGKHDERRAVKTQVSFQWYVKLL